MNLRDLQYLVALADEGNFSRAAIRSGVSQPTLSTQVRKLEAELGVPLIERAPGGIVFTHPGREVVARARHVLTDIAEMRALAVQSADPAASTITLGMFPTLGPYLLPHLMPAVRAALPHLALRLVEEKSEALLAQLARGDIDALTLAEEPVADGVTSIPLFKEDFVLALPDGHPLGDADRPVRLTDLADHRVLLLDEGHCLRDQTRSLCEAVGARQDSFRATSLESLRYMVASGRGITLLPRLSVTAPVAQPAGLVLRDFAAPAPRRTIRLAFRETSPLAALLHQLADIIRSAAARALD